MQNLDQLNADTAAAIRKIAVIADEVLLPALGQVYAHEAYMDELHQEANRLRRRASNEAIPGASRVASERRADELAAKRVALAEANADIREAVDELTMTYRAVRWARFYYVPAGHVHRTHCSTLRPTTVRYGLPEYSGASDAEIIEAAGDKACTVCFADAPVNPNRSTIRYAVEEREARAAEAAERASKREKAAAAHIIDSRGKVAYKTLRGLTNAISSEAFYWVMSAAEQHHEQNYVDGVFGRFPFTGSNERRARNAADYRGKVEALVKLAQDNGHDVREYVAKAIARHSKALDRDYFTPAADLAL